MSQQTLLGIFDSGVGGFSVYKKIKQTSNANVIYYGDCLRAPYGNREEAEIVQFIKDDIKFLQDEGVTHFVNACNSMSVLTTKELLCDCEIAEENYTDMIRAFITHATFKETDNVLVIATLATIRSKVYQEVILNKKATPHEYVFTDLAGLIENNSSREVLMSVVEKAILYAKEIGATHIVYGCTHYPLIHDFFKIQAEKLGWGGVFIDPAVYVAQEVKKWNLIGERKFTPYSSKDTAVFIKNVIQQL